MSDFENDFLAELQMGFIQEASDLLSSLEGSFLILEKVPKDKQEIDKILRIFHNLKGSAAAVEFATLSAFCHKVESFLVLVKNDEFDLNNTAIDFLLKALDKVNGALGLLQNDLKAQIDFSDISEWFVKIVQGKKQDNKNDDKNDNKKVVSDTYLASASKEAAPFVLEIDARLIGDYVGELKEHLDAVDAALMLLEKNSGDSEHLDSLFRSFHTIKSASGILNFQAISAFAHTLESCLEPVRDKQHSFDDRIAGVCFEAVLLLRKICERLIAGDSKAEQVYETEMRALAQRAQLSIPQEKGRPSEAIAGPVADNDKKQESSSNSGTTIREPIKVEAERLDRLVDSIGELVISETMVSQSDDLKNIPPGSAIYKHLDRLNKITRNLQEIGMALRMVPIRQTFKKIVRIVRDISKKVDKEVVFETYGEETELDRTVAEKIGDPLVHMIRNAVDHGLEATADRLRLGKDSKGRVSLGAYHKGGNIWIEIKDDGRGLNRDKILTKALEKKLIEAAAVKQMTDADVYGLIFLPGFSTAEKVTDISGRGVGMDVVHRNIVEELHGAVDIESRLGEGTTFRIRIPNTLAIIEGMVVTVGSERYVMPTQSIVMALRPEAKNIVHSAGTKREMLSLVGETLALFRVAEIFDVANAITDPTEGIILVIEDNRRKIGLLVDKILKQQQFVIKGLGENMKNVPGVSGGTIMPDGQVGLILDASLLL